VVGSGGRRGENAQGAPALLILERRGRGVPAVPHGVGSKDGPSKATRPAAGLMFGKPPVPNTAITLFLACVSRFRHGKQPPLGPFTSQYKASASINTISGLSQTFGRARRVD
jgi:hypothetical protein